MEFPTSSPSILTLAHDLLGYIQHERRTPLLPELAAVLRPEQHIILFVVDGMGQHFVEAQGSSIFATHRRRVLHSLYPSATVPAITTFLTGVSPAEHGLLGWETYQDASDPLPVLVFTGRYRASKEPLADERLQAFYRTPSLFRSAAVPTTVAQIEATLGTYTRTLTAGADYVTLPSEDPREALPVLQELFQRPGPRYTYIHWGTLDHIGHEEGYDSAHARSYFQELCVMFATLENSLPKDTVLIVTADHGQIVVGPEDHLFLEHFPKLAAFLAKPLSGEPRLPVVHLHPGSREQFAAYIAGEFAEYATFLPTEEIITRQLLGPHFDPLLLGDRIGDGFLVMHKHYLLKDILPGETKFFYAGAHGGISPEEMEVPLCIFTARS